MSDDTASTPRAQSPLDQLTAWEKWTESFWREHSGFAACAHERLLVHLRTYHPQGQIARPFLQALFRALLQRLIDGRLPDYDADLHGPLRWSAEQTPVGPDERYQVMEQVIEGVASGILDDYKQALWRRWEARPATLDARRGIGLVFRQCLEAHCAAVDALFQSLGETPKDPLSLALCIEEAEADWREAFRSGGGLTTEERTLIARLAHSVLGDWFSGLGEDDQAGLKQFQVRALTLQNQVRRLLADVSSLQTYTQQCVEQVMLAEWGLEIDAAGLQVRTQHLRNGVPSSRTTSLVSLAMEGPYLPSEKKRREVLQTSAGPGALLTPGFIDRLLADMDPRSGYRNRLRAAYRNPELDTLLSELYDVRLRQSAFIARCRGHLSAESHERVMRTLEDGRDQGDVTGLLLFSDLQLAGPLLFTAADYPGSSLPLVIYAPDKPDGQEWIELPSMRQVSVELGRWVENEAGRAWLLGLINSVDQVRTRQFFIEAVERAESWDLLQDRRAPLMGYRQCVARTLAIRQANHLQWVDFHEAPRWFCELPLARRQLIAGINEDLRLLDEQLQQRMGARETYRDFARRTVEADSAAYLREQGVTERVEPETLLFDFIPGLNDANPKRTLSLLDLALYGYDDNWGLDNPRLGVRSSVGQDVSKLRAAELTHYVRRAYLGERYADTLRKAFLDETASDYAPRRALYGQWIATTMIRDVQVAQAKGFIEPAQSESLSAFIGRLARGQLQGEMRRLVINGRPAVGLYVLRVESDSRVEHWLYTPLAPDSLTFRKYSSFLGARAGAMHDYYLGRVRFQDREVVARRLLLLAERKVERDGADAGAPVTDLRDEYNDYLQSHIDDVEAVSNSRHEVIMSLVTKGLVYAAMPLSLAFPPLGVALDVAYVVMGAANVLKAAQEDDPDGAVEHWRDVMMGLWGMALPLGWMTFRAAVWGCPKPLDPRGRMIDPKRPASGQGMTDEPLLLDKRKALRRTPENLQALEADGLWRGVYASTEPGSRLRCVRQNGRWFEVVHDADNHTLRLVDPRSPNAAYKLPIHQDGWGRWVFNPTIGLRGGGGGDVRYLGRVSRVAAAFPDRCNPAPVRGALQGEGVIGRFRSGASDNYLYSLNAQTCVVASLYNPVTRMGAVIHVDHNIRQLAQSALDSALAHIGHQQGNELKAVLVGGDWLSGGADIGGPMKSLLAQKGISAAWDHWSWSSCFSNTYGVSLDLAEGVTTVFTTGGSAVQDVVNPILREARAGATSAIAQRGRRFMERFGLEPLVQRPDGTVRTPRGEVASAVRIDQQALALHVLD